MSEFISTYYPLLAGLLSLAASQGLKILFYVLKDKRFDPDIVFAAGGMPSTHSSMVCGLTTALGISYGWDSVPFAIGVIFSLVVLYDAAGVRQSVGTHATMINRLRERVQNQPIEKHEKLTEVVGHKPIEIAVGSLLGIVVATLLSLM